jgi:hypothetical protein
LCRAVDQGPFHEPVSTPDRARLKEISPIMRIRSRRTIADSRVSIVRHGIGRRPWAPHGVYFPARDQRASLREARRLSHSRMMSERSIINPSELLICKMPLPVPSRLQASLMAAPNVSQRIGSTASEAKTK